MMMASFQQQQQQNSKPPTGKIQHGFLVDPSGNSSNKKVATADYRSHSPREISPIFRPPDPTEIGCRSSTTGYANPPFLPQENPNISANNDQQYQQQQEQPLLLEPQQGLIYVNRSTRAATQPQEEEQVAAEARQHLRLSNIKSAARGIGERGSPAGTSSVTSANAAATMNENMPTFPALALRGGAEGDEFDASAAGMPAPAPHQQHPSPYQSSVAAVTPVSPSLLAGTPVTPLSPQAAFQPPQDAATSVASAAAAVALQHQQHQQRGIPHIYHDFANVPDSVGYVRKKTGGVTQPFPEKLHELLEKESTPDFHLNVQAIVGWLPHGRAFLVRKPKEFTRDIMPKYFRQTKLTSFQRQLNLYGFRRITQGTDAGAYYHELFLRGRRNLCMRMVRQKVKGTGHKQPADAQTEPNFYALPPTTGSATSSPAAPPPIAPSSPRPASPLLMGPPASITTRAMMAPPFDQMSPGTRGVHGAASLLKGIAAGVAPSRLKSINPASASALPFLGPPAEKAYDGSKTMAVGSPVTSATQSFSLLLYDRPTEREEKHEKEEERGDFSSSPPPQSSYSSLLWGGGAPAPSPAPVAPPASFLWPQSAPAPAPDPPAAGESHGEDDKEAAPREPQEAA